MKRALGLACGLLFACHGQDGLLGEEEPIRVRMATFHEGDLAGAIPSTNGTPEGSHVTIVETPNSVLRPGQAGKSFRGRVTDDAVALGVQLAGEGTGHWVLPLGSPDPAAPGELNWAISLDVAHDAPPGLHQLLLAALREDGTAGTQFALPICIRGATPDNLSACDPSLAPPFAVLSLEWDSGADLDLLVVTPEGKFVDPKHPSTAPVTPGEDGEPDEVVPRPGDGRFDVDGMSACNPVAGRRENLVFQQKPIVGTYFVLVRLFDACHESAARFAVTLHLAEGNPPQQREVLRVPGVVLAEQALGGDDVGLFVTEFAIQ